MQGSRSKIPEKIFSCSDARRDLIPALTGYGKILRFAARNVNESVDETRQHNLGHLHTGMGGPLSAPTSVTKYVVFFKLHAEYKVINRKGSKYRVLGVTAGAGTSCDCEAGM
jgi:hypothetical protein